MAFHRRLADCYAAADLPGVVGKADPPKNKRAQKLAIPSLILGPSAPLPPYPRAGARMPGRAEIGLAKSAYVCGMESSPPRGYMGAVAEHKYVW